MQKEKITELFDQQASSYDERWSKTAPINSALHLLVSKVFSGLPSEARILCVGAGTGAEIMFLAQKFPGWHFTAVEPSSAMLDVLRRRAEECGITSRCTFHSGYLESLQSFVPFHAATAFLVSQFITERKNRIEFFQGIADRLGSEGILVSSDLAGNTEASDFRSLLEVWFRLTSGEESFSPEGGERMRETYTRDVAVFPPCDVCDIISQGGFDTPIQFYQAGLIHAWYARRASNKTKLN